jgi:hypothetical protein
MPARGCIARQPRMRPTPCLQSSPGVGRSSGRTRCPAAQRPGWVRRDFQSASPSSPCPLGSMTMLAHAALPTVELRVAALRRWARSDTALIPRHPAWLPGQAWIAAGGGADRRSAKNAAVPLNNRAKRTTRCGRSTPPRGPTVPDASNPRATVHEATRRSRCHGLGPTERPTRSHAQVGMTLPATANADATLMGRGTSNVLSYRYATSPESGRTGYSTTKVTARRAISALTAR